jgi:isocitrate dehydrogenase
LATQDQNLEIKAKFAQLAQALSSQEAVIVAELKAAQGKAVDIGGYYHPDRDKTIAAMRPSWNFNSLITLWLQLFQLSPNNPR